MKDERCPTVLSNISFYFHDNSLIHFSVLMGRDNGAIGSRLTGAGWGGCAVHLVREENVKSFMDVLRKEYYEKYGYSEEQIQQGLFASKPSAGACYFEGLTFCSCLLDGNSLLNC